MNLNALGAFVAVVSIPGAISRYYWIRPEPTQAGFKNLAKGSLISLSMQVASIVVGVIGNTTEEDKRFNIAYTIMMVASIPAAVALAGRLNFKLSYEEAATTAALCWASFMGLLKSL